MNTPSSESAWVVLEPSSIEALLALEQAVFDEPWAKRSLENQLKHCRAFNLGLLTTHGALIAYASFSVLLDEAELYRLAVHPDYRRQGLARKILAESWARFKARQVEKCLLEVNENNRAAVQLYKSIGFEQDGIRKGYYDGDQGPEHALLMTCHFHKE